MPVPPLMPTDDRAPLIMCRVHPDYYVPCPECARAPASAETREFTDEELEELRLDHEQWLLRRREERQAILVDATTPLREQIDALTAEVTALRAQLAEAIEARKFDALILAELASLEKGRADYAEAQLTQAREQLALLAPADPETTNRKQAHTE